MMKIPIMTTEDFIRLANKQKSGKAAGTDGIKAEVFKHLCKNKEIIKAMVKAINNIPFEKKTEGGQNQEPQCYKKKKN